MTKTDLIDQIAKSTKTTKKDAGKVVDAFFTTVEKALAAGDKVQLVGFGTFEVRERKARKGRNPQSGVEIDIPATKVPAFKAGKGLKDSLS